MPRSDRDNGAMSPFAETSAANPVPPSVAGFTHRMLASCLDIKEVWSIGHTPGEPWSDAEPCRLLVFADAAVLERLQDCEDLHDASIEVLVVVDGNAFASAWGPTRLSGSLARWAWRQTAENEAYYEESRWAEQSVGGAVVRVRRKAYRICGAD